jgi:hypothetical protein
MKNKLIAVAILSISAIVSSTTSAVAAENSEYKASVESFKAEKLNYSTAKKAINEKFKTDAAASKAKTKAAVEAATTAEAKKAAKASGKAEIDSLIAARNSAIVALAKPTAKPVKPTKTEKPVKPAAN